MEGLFHDEAPVFKVKDNSLFERGREELFMVVDMVFYMCQVEATPKSLNSAFWYIAIFLCPSM